MPSPPTRVDHTLGWAVRYHPRVRPDRSAADRWRRILPAHRLSWDGETLLFRAAGYRWNGTTWYWPGQVWDPIAHDYERRKARAAVTVSATDMLDGRAHPNLAYIGKVAAFERVVPHDVV